jgi:hypothetical protein
MEETMKKQVKKLIAVLMILAITLSLLPMTVSAGSSDYMKVTRNKSYNKNGMHYTSYDVKNITDYYLTVIGQYLNSSGKVLKTFSPNTINVGETGSWSYGMDFSNLPGGTYTFKLTVYIGHENHGNGWYWTNNINHSVPAPSISYNSYEMYYDSKGVLMHKVNINCKNMKGQRLYCKVYDQDGYLMYDWGNDTPARKTNNEVGYFGWSGGWYNGGIQPSGYYTFVISNSANNTVISKTLWLTIPQGGNG